MNNPPISSSNANSDKSLQRWLLLLVAMAMLIRCWIHFRIRLVPGVDAAYYLIQARALLGKGTLHFADLPLTFWLQAGFARLIQRVSGISQDAAIVASVKTLDSLLPPLVAIPMGLLGWRWHRKETPSLLAALVPAAAASLSALMLRMTGDFQKNSLGLIWLALLMLSSHTFLRKPSWKNALIPLLALGLSGLTHVGVLGSAFVFSAFLLGFALLSFERKIALRALIMAAVGAAILLGIAALVTSLYKTSKFDSLFKALLAPMAGVLGQSAPGERSHFHILPAIPWLILACAVARIAWRGRASLPAADRVVAQAAAFSAAALVMFDREGRLMLIAVLPTAQAISFLLANVQCPKTLRYAGGILLGLVLSSAAISPGSPSMIDDAGYEELLTMSKHTDPPERSVVVARHGLEFWVAWALHTQIVQTNSVSPAYLAKFDKVFYLREKEDPMHRMMGFPPRGPGGPPGPPGGGWGPPPPAPPGFPPGPGNMGPDNPMQSPEFPDNAQIVHECRFFKLAIVTHTPNQ